MKKLKYLFVLLIALLLVPIMTFAEGEEETTIENTAEGDNSEVIVYLFRGEGCPHCQEAEEWFESIEEEYGSLFKVVDYETWNDEDNAELMQKVAEARDEKAEGVPYIIIGNKSWNGFTDSYKDEMIEEIKAEHDKAPADRIDALAKVTKAAAKDKKKEKDSSGDVIALLAILVVVGGVCYGVYKARNNTN